MKIVTFILVGIILIPALLFCFEFYLCKKNSKFALILPIITACFFILVGFYALIISAIMFGIYFIMKHIGEKNQTKQSELDKMNIQDLE